MSEPSQPSAIGTRSGRRVWAALGPGVLFTGAAVGVSHLVQSTRAGAMYGLSLLFVVVLANVVKYPAFRFGPLYAAATGTSLLEGYRRQGRWALVLYALLTLGTMFTVQAAVTLVTAGLAKVLFGLSLSPLVLSVLLLAICGALVATGGYRWLDKVSKAVVSVLAISTVVATLLVLPRVDWSSAVWVPEWSALDVAFVVALAGWMPSAIDVSVWQSIWTLARADETGHRPSGRESGADFYIGYVGTSVLAVCFVILGAAVLHRDGLSVEAAPGDFAAQLISLYADTLGEWSRPLIGVVAFATMFSTTLTVVDGFPRALAVLYARLLGPETARHDGAEEALAADRALREPTVREPTVREPALRAPTLLQGTLRERTDKTPAYYVALAVLLLGASLVLAFFVGTMRTLIDVATTLSFLSAPVLSWLNHRAVTSDEVPPAMRPAPWLRAASWSAIGITGVFAIVFVVSLIQGAG